MLALNDFVSTHFPHLTCVLVNKYFSFLLLFKTLHVDFIALMWWIIEVLVKGTQRFHELVGVPLKGYTFSLSCRDYTALFLFIIL